MTHVSEGQFFYLQSHFYVGTYFKTPHTFVAHCGVFRDYGNVQNSHDEIFRAKNSHLVVDAIRQERVQFVGRKVGMHGVEEMLYLEW